jgi:hypothetical protein
MAIPGPYHRGKLRTLFGLSLAEWDYSEGSAEHEAQTVAEHEDGQAAAPAAEWRSEAGSGSSQPAGVAAEATPFPAALASPAPVVQRRLPAFLALIVGACAVAFLVAFLALIAGQWQPTAVAPAMRARKATKPQPASLGVVGIIAFKSSGDFAGNSAAGMNDEVVIQLTGVAAPPAGASYFAWMSGASGSEAVWTPLGRLVWTPAPLSGFAPPAGIGPQSGTASLFFVALRPHNLLMTFTRFLITEEATSIAPLQPSSAWLYQASISATPTPGDPHHYSLLDHLRHLLAADPSLAAVGIKGGLVYWLTRNSGQVAEAASHLETDWQSHLFRDLRQRLIRILTYLDGSSFVGADLPPGTPRPSPSPATRIGLLTLATNQQPPGYVLHTDIHLEGVRDALGATDSQRQEALQLRSAMNAVGDSLSNVREDALQLIRMDNTHLAQPSTLPLLKDLATQAQEAYAGPAGQGQTTTNAAVGPSSSSFSSSSPAAGAGVKWIESQSQQLAIFTWYRV